MYKIKYKELAVGAADEVEAECEDLLSGATLTLSGDPVEYATFENVGIDLNVPMQLAGEGDYIGFVSDAVSDSNGEFGQAPIWIEFTAPENTYYSSVGLTIEFYGNPAKEIEMEVGYMAGGEYTTKSVTVINADLTCFLPLDVDNWIYISVLISSTNDPKCFCKIKRVLFGKEIDISRFKSVSSNTAINILSEDLSINSNDFTCISSEQLKIQKDQEAETFFNDDLMGVFRINENTQLTEDQYSIETEDLVSVLDGVAFDGGIYSNKSAALLADEISSVCGIPIRFDENVGGVVSGYLPICTCRFALMQLAFAIGAMVDTSGQKYIFLRKIPDTVMSIIGSDRIIGNATLEQSKVLTGGTLTTYTYSPGTSEEKLFEQTGTFQSFRIDFEDPVVVPSLTITGGTFDEVHPNYVIFSGTDITITGTKFEKTGTDHAVRNESLLNPKILNIKQFNDYTLRIADLSEKLDDIRKYISSAGTVKVKALLNGEKVGDLITVETRFNGPVTGIISSMSYKFGYDLLADLEVMEWG